MTAVRPTREELLARISDVLRRSKGPNAEQQIRLLELNLPAQLAHSREEAREAETITLTRRGDDVYLLTKHLRSAGEARSLAAARTQAEILIARKASLDPTSGAEPWGLTTRDDGFDRYLGRFRDELVGGIATLLTASGVSDAAALAVLLWHNVRSPIRTDENLVERSIRENRLIDAARYHSARTGEDREASRRHVTELRRQFESEPSE